MALLLQTQHKLLEPRCLMMERHRTRKWFYRTNERIVENERRMKAATHWYAICDFSIFLRANFCAHHLKEGAIRANPQSALGYKGTRNTKQLGTKYGRPQNQESVPVQIFVGLLQFPPGRCTNWTGYYVYGQSIMENFHYL